MTDGLKLRPFGKLLNLIESSGFKVEHQFDDLVFVDNTAFIFQFDNEDPEFVMLRFNIDCKPANKEFISASLLEKSKEEDVKLVLASDYEIKENPEEETFQLIFK